MTLRRSHGSGSPRNFDNVITPNRIETAGAIVKIAVETIVRRICAVSIPSSFPRRYARIRKNNDYAITNTMIAPAKINNIDAFG